MSEEINPWTILAKKEIYENPWISVTEFDVLNPAGGKGIYGLVHFRNLAIGVLPLDAEKNTFLVGQYRFPLNKYSWEIPEGGCPQGTDPLDTAKRELLEETGLVAKHWEKLMEIHTSNSVTDEWGAIYIATDLAQGESMPEDTEKIVVKKMPFEKAYQLVVDGTITDSISVAAILRTKLLIADGKL